MEALRQALQFGMAFLLVTGLLLAQIPPTWGLVAISGPSARELHAMAHDSGRGRTVLFGGRNGSALGDTWEWNGVAWNLMATTGPSPRYRHRMAYDSARGRTVMFGGNNGGSETWEWDGNNWALVATTGPQPLSYLAMTFDSIRNRTVLLMGGGPGSYYSETWEWDGTHWAQRANSGPYFFSSGGMAFDRLSGRTILFDFSSTFAWNGISWTWIPTNSPVGGGLGGLSSVMVYDSIRNVAVLFGNFVSTFYTNTTWEWNGSVWAEAVQAGPLPGYGHAAAFDSNRNACIAFGGYISSNTLTGNTWSYSDNWIYASTSFLGSSCPGSAGAPSLTVQGGSVPRPGTSLQLQLGNLPVVATVCIGFFGFDNQQINGQPLPASLAPYGMPGCNIYTDIFSTQFLFTLAGSVPWVVYVPPLTSMLGTHFYPQALVFDPLAGNQAGIISSNAIDALIGY